MNIAYIIAGRQLAIPYSTSELQGGVYLERDMRWYRRDSILLHVVLVSIVLLAFGLCPRSGNLPCHERN